MDANYSYIEEANIGHSIVSKAVFVGLESAVREMKQLLNDTQFKPVEFKVSKLIFSFDNLKEESLVEVIKKLDKELANRKFSLWMEGEMGAGKTTFVREFLRYRGLPEETPVSSPTYTILNEYKLGDEWYAHMDLYRAEEEFSMDEIGVRDTREYQGFFIEWPEVPSDEETIRPTHKLVIEYREEGDSRSYQLFKI